MKEKIKFFLNELNQTYHANLLIMDETLEAIAMVYADNNSQVNSYFCFNYNETVCLRCQEFAKSCIIKVLTSPITYLHEKCWAGFRLSAKKITINAHSFYAVIDAFLLDTDLVFDDIELEGTGLLQNEIDLKRDKINMFTAEQIENYFLKVEDFLNELSEKREID